MTDTFGLTAPPYWWLLGLTVLGQIPLFVRVALFRLSGNSSSQATSGPVFWVSIIGGLLGLVYGYVQSDAVFVLGQSCVLVLLIAHRRANDFYGEETWD